MRILFLDDDETRHKHAASELIGHDVHHVRTAQRAIETLKSHEFDLAMLDHDLGGEQHGASHERSGYVVAEAIPTMDRPPRMVIVHSFNAPGAGKMIAALGNAGIPCVWAPFGPTAFKIARGAE